MGASIGRSFDLLLPTEIDARPGLEFTDSPKNYVRKTGTLNDLMWVIEPQDSPWGTHASNDRKSSVCGVGSWTNAETLGEGSPETIAPRVRCQFCQARLVNAGVMDPVQDYVRSYAKDYGTRPLP